MSAPTVLDTGETDLPTLVCLHSLFLDPRMFDGLVEAAVHLLPHIPARTLVVSGTEDPARPPAWADQLAEHLPNATLWRLERVGHSPVLEVPDIVLPRILDFLSEGEPTASQSHRA